MLISYAIARELVDNALQGHGFSESERAACTAEILDAEWRGLASHGLALIPDLVEWSAGKRHDPLVVHRLGCSAFVQGGDGPGPFVAEVAMEAAMSLADTHGLGCVGVENRSPLLMAGFQPRRAAVEGFIGIAMCTAPAKVAPAGGITPVFGTNPIAAAFPRRDAPPIVVDMAMSKVPASEIRRRARLGEQLPEGVAIDSLGQPTTDPRTALAGAMLAFGEHKGSALALVVELLVGGLTGSRVGVSQPGERGMLFLALRPDLFGNADAFYDRSASIVQDLLASGPAVRVPGLSEPNFDLPVNIPEAVVHAVEAMASRT